MNQPTASIERARETVLGVLRGDLTPDTHPGVFEDDILYFAVERLGRQDASWLETELLSSEHGLNERRLVASMATPRIRQRVAAQLGF
jgi:hypothetical protein